MTSFFFRHRQKAIPTLVAVAFSLFFIQSSNNYSIGKGGASATCLHARVFLIDHADTSLHYDQLLAFIQTKSLTFMPESVGETWIKILIGKPGDTVVVTLDQVTVTRTDGTTATYSLNARRVIASLDWQEAVEREWVLGDGELFVMGETESSFDSRFWGPTQIANIQGTSYALF